MDPPQPNPEVIRATWRWLAHAAHGVSEVRVIRPGGGILGIGFFDDDEAFVRECCRTNAAGNVYVGIQPRPRRLLALAPNAVRPLRSGAGRKDIEVLTATVIDLDPVRPKDTASTEAELEAAIDAASQVADWCAAGGLARPQRMMSGNGAQLWYAIPPLRLSDDNRERVQAHLKQFEAEARAEAESDAVKVDSIHDVARIIKVIGTVSRKGDPTSERPHRVSAPLDGLDRVEDAALATLLLEASPPGAKAPARAHLPVVAIPPALTGTTKARRTPEGEYDWQAPVEMCGPVQRLWEQGCEDRSLAIFDMVRFFAHKGLGLDEITDLVVEYDRRGLGKLAGRDGPGYVRHCHEKITAGAQDDGTIAPPCHSLQRLGYCRVNHDPGARCEIYDYVFDIEKAAEAIPEDAAPRELEYRLRPILEAISHREPAVQSRYIELLQKRFRLKARDLRSSMKEVGRRAQAGSAASPAAKKVSAGDGGTDADAEEDNGPDADGTIDGEIFEDAACYYTVTPRGEQKVVSSFAITPTLRIDTEDGEMILGDAHTDKGTHVSGLRLPLSSFHSKRDLVRHLPSADLQWTGSDNNVQGLLRVLARRPVPRRPGATMLGAYERGEHRLWVCPQGAITKHGFVDPSPIVYVPSGASLDGRLRYRPTDDATFSGIARTVFEYLPKVNAPEVVLPVIGWFFATPLKPQFMERVRSFPALYVWGTQGSGKSSLITDVMWPLFGVRDSEPYSATETEFALLKILTATRSIPIFIDEYKPYDMPKHRLNVLHRYLRRAFRGEAEERGRADQTVNTYYIRAPVCVAGEVRPSEPALLERAVTSNPDKVTLEERADCRAAFRELRAVELSLFAPRYIQFCLGRDFDADLEVARGAAEALLHGRKIPIRVGENVTAMLFGIHLFEQFAAACGHTLPVDLGAQAAVDAVLDDVLEGDQHAVKSALDQFVEMLGVMAIQGELRFGTHYTFKDAILYVHLESAYDSFRQHCKRIDFTGEVVDLKALRRLLHENRRQGGYVTSEGERVYFGTNTSRRRAFGIDPEKTALVDVESFPQEAPQGRGFGRDSRYGD